MALVLPNEGLTDLLAYWLGKTVNTFFDWQLVLFKNSFTPTQATVYADLVLATFTGYSPVTVTKANWTSPVIDTDKAVSTWTTTPTLWTCTAGSETIYGYALVTPSSPKILVVERFASPVPIAPGGIIGVLPRVTFTTAP
jgi:hypothetical protein